MKKYKVHSERYTSVEFTDLDKALKEYEYVKDAEISDEVDMDSYVELISSIDDFEDSEKVKRAIIVVDEEKMAISTPKEEGYEWEYWAKWKEV